LSFIICALGILYSSFGYTALSRLWDWHDFWARSVKDADQKLLAITLNNNIMPMNNEVNQKGKLKSDKKAAFLQKLLSNSDKIFDFLTLKEKVGSIERVQLGLFVAINIVWYFLMGMVFVRFLSAVF
jgi:hypothetical protein